MNGSRAMEPAAYLDSLRPAGSKRSTKRDLIVNVFLRQEGQLTADDLFDLIRREELSKADPACLRTDEPCHGVPDAAVDGRCRHRTESRFRRGPIPV